jgi:hypothetical protein
MKAMLNDLKEKAKGKRKTFAIDGCEYSIRNKPETFDHMLDNLRHHDNSHYGQKAKPIKVPHVPKGRELNDTPYDFKLGNVPIEMYNVPVFAKTKAPRSIPQDLIRIKGKSPFITNGYFMIKKKFISNIYRYGERIVPSDNAQRIWEQHADVIVGDELYEVGRIINGGKRHSVMYNGEQTMFFESKYIDLVRSIPNIKLYSGGDHHLVIVHNENVIGILMGIILEHGYDVVIKRK